MKFESKYYSLLLVALSISMVNLSTSAQSATEIDRVLSQLDNGKVVGNVYENKLLALRIRFPKIMSPDNKEELAADVKEGIELLKRGAIADKRIIDEMLRKERIVLSLDLPQTDDSIGAAMSLTIKKDETTEELRPMIDRTIKLFAGSGKQKLVVSPKEEKLGVLTVISFSTSTDVEGTTVYSKLYTCRRNGYLLTFSIAYQDEKSLSTMEAVLKGIEGISEK